MSVITIVARLTIQSNLQGYLKEIKIFGLEQAQMHNVRRQFPGFVESRDGVEAQLNVGSNQRFILTRSTSIPVDVRSGVPSRGEMEDRVLAEVTAYLSYFDERYNVMNFCRDAKGFEDASVRNALYAIYIWTLQLRRN